MNEEKLYAVKNDEGKYWNFADRDGFFESDFASCSATDDERYTKNVVRDHGGHVVALVEEPKKVVLTKEQAEIVDDAHDGEIPATFISRHSDNEELLMNAYVNGYTVAKEKKYNVKVPYTDYKWYQKTPDGKLDTIWVKGLSKGFGGYPDGIELTKDDIEEFGLQDCEKVECDNDD